MKRVELGRTVNGNGIFEGQRFVPIVLASCDVDEFESRLSSVRNCHTVKRLLVASAFSINSDYFTMSPHLWAEVEPV